VSRLAAARVRLRAEPRAPLPIHLLVIGSAGVIVLAFAVVGVALAATGYDPVEVYRLILKSAFGSVGRWQQTLLAATPLILTGLAAAIAFKMLVFNIGGEGQLYIGAICTSGVAVLVGDGLPSGIAIPLVLCAGALGGAVFASIPAVLMVRFGASEAISTLMLNFVALNLMSYLIFDTLSPWRDPDRPTFPVGRQIPESTWLPSLWGAANYGLVIAAALAVVVWVIMSYTRWGLDSRAIGASPRASASLGVNVRAGRFLVLCLSGAFAGLAGAVSVTGPLKALTPEALTTTRLGFTGILVAAVARFNPLAVVPVGVLIAGFLNSSRALQLADVPYSVVLMLVGALFLVVIAGDFLMRHKISVVRSAGERGSDDHVGRQSEATQDLDAVVDTSRAAM
jgi:simple sugar transport system permease protein